MTGTQTRMEQLRTQAQERILRERESLKLVLARSGVSLDDLATARRVLMDLGRVDLRDLHVAPGFRLLGDGSVGSVDTDTAEWQHWSRANTFVEDCQSLGVVLARFA